MGDLEEIYFTPEELAREYKVSERTITRLIERKELTALRVGRQWRISESAKVDYEERNRNF